MAAAGIASRRKCEELITGRRVSVNGSVITELGTKVDPETDKIVVNGRPLPKLTKRYYIALNKPRGIVSAVSDPHGAKTVTSLIDLQSRPLLRPVGRLDMDSEGLIFLTDDGEFLNKLTHPRHNVGKTYSVVVSGVPQPETLQRLARGIRLEDGMTQPATGVRIIRKFKSEEGNENAQVEITIFEGRNRQVRRMFQAVGHSVQKLKRIAIGPVRLTGLPAGAWRHLTPKEVETLLTAADTESKKNEDTSWPIAKPPFRPAKAQSSQTSMRPTRPSPRRTSSDSPTKGSTTD